MKRTAQQTISAGGIVIKEWRGKKYLLLTKDIELPKWQIPKGKIIKGENIRQAALREVYEETGLTKIKITKKLGIIIRPHVKNSKILKKIHHYLFTLTGEEKLQPQDRKHSQAKWFTYNQAIKNLLIKEQKGLLIKNKEIFQ